jgi:crossover junction endodeoxyribonuclease RuvC
MTRSTRILGIDPGLSHTGWGIIDAKDNRLSFIAGGRISTKSSHPLASRLVHIADELREVVARHAPTQAAVEETFVNVNPKSTLKLGHARAMALFIPAQAGLQVAEYPANLVKKSVVGSGHASKDQVEMMVNTLLTGVEIDNADTADALAVAICHAHHADHNALVESAMEQGAAQ